MERLQKFLAHAGVASRRKSEELILEGKVSVNEEVIRELGVKINPRKDIVKVNGKEIKSKERKEYVLLNKPSGYLSTVSDDRERKTIMELLTDVKARVYPVGRLDCDSKGLLLLTNDGELAYRLTHPKFEVFKTYEVVLDALPKKAEIEKLEAGVELEDGLTAPARIRVKKENRKNAVLHISIREGKNRQVRRMFDFFGYRVLHLKRFKMGSLTLGNLKEGRYRYLSKEEIALLKKDVSL